MNHLTPVLRRRNLRVFISAFITYIMLAGQVAPLALAASAPNARRAQASGEAAPAPPTIVSYAPIPQPLVAAPNITATKADSFPDPNANGKAEPGDTITYTVTISNAGSSDATGVTFNDSVDTNTTLVPGSVNTQPIALDDSYNVIGNVRIQPNAAQGLLANDRDPDTGNNTGLTASGPTTTTQNGNITINGDGSFSYNPAPGFAGTDTVTYTVTDTGGKTDTAVATFLVGNGTSTPGTNVVWFVNPSAPSGGDGRLTNPFNCYTGVAASCFSQTAADDPGDIIFLFNGSHTGGNALLANQKLVGQGASDTLANIAGLTVPTGSDALPATNSTPSGVTITTTNVNAVPLPTGATNTPLLRGFTVGNTGTGTKISGTNFGTLTAGNNTTPDVILNGTGQALNLSTGTFAATSAFASVTTTSSGAQGINLAGIAGTVAFNGTQVSNSTTQGILIGTTTADINFGNTIVTAGSDAVSFQNNSSGTRTFGALTATAGGTGIAFNHGAGGGNVTVNNLSTLTSGSGNTIDIQNQASSTTVNFTGGATLTKTAGGTGVNLNTDNGNVTFGGTLTIGTSGARFPATAVTITGGTTGVFNLGTVSIFTNGFAGITATNADGTLNVTAGTVDVNAASALNIDGPAGITTLGITLGTVNSTGGTNNVSLVDVGGSVTLSGGALSGATGASFLVGAGTASITFNGTITNNTARAVDVQGHTGGTVAFGGAITSNGGQGVFLNNNTGATINFTGGLSLSTGVNAAFTATGGGTVSATQNNTTIVNTLATTTATALNVTSTTIGASGLTFRSITSNGAGTADGIILNNTGTTAGLTVTGNGGTCTAADQTGCSGGTIQNKTGADGSQTQGTGIYLNNTSGVSLTRMFLQTFQNHAIYGTNVTGFSLANSNIAGINGTSSAGGSREGDVHFDNLFTSASFPTASISNCNLGGTSFSDILRVFNTSGTLNRLVVDTVTFGTVGINGNDAMVVVAFNNSTVNVTLQDSTLTNAIGSDLRVNANNTSTVDAVIRRNKFSNNNPNISSGGGLISAQSGGTGTNATFTYDISCNTFRDSIGIAVLVAHNGGTGTTTGSIINNTVGVSGVPLSGSTQASGIKVALSGVSNTHTTMIANNVVRQTNEVGIFLQNNNGSGTLNASVFGNTVAEPGSFQFAGLNVDIGALAGDTSKANVVVGSATDSTKKNDFSAGDPSNFSDVNFSLIGTGPLNLSRNGSASGTVAGVIDDDNLNPATTNTAVSGTVTLVNTLPPTPPTVNTCTLPTGPETFDGDSVAPGGIGTNGDIQNGAPEAQPASAPTAAQTDAAAPSVAAPAAVTPTFNLAPTATAFATRTAPATPKPLVVQKTKRGTALQYSASDTSAPLGGDDNNALSVQKGRRVLTSDPGTPNGAGGTVSINIGTLKPNDSVTITFQVTVDNPYSGGPNVSNQGTVSGSNFANVLTNDPDTAAPNDPTLTPINSTDIRINNAKESEPAAGTRQMLFTLSLSQPAGAGGLSVSFSTANGTATGGASCDGTADYVTVAGGTATVAAGSQTGTVPVTVCADNVGGESDETFTVTISNPSSGTIQVNQATGTITQANSPGTFLISELRTSGPVGPNDDFVEFYNNTNSPLTVTASDASAGFGLFKMGATCSDTPVLIGIIPNGTTIPARGHYLAVGTSYSLANYGGTGAAAGNLTLTSDIENDRNVAVFSTANIVNISSANRLDAVGFGTNTGGVCDLLREGTNLPPVSGSTTEHSFFRKECDFVSGQGCTTAGTPKDANDNSVDFMFADTNGTFISGVPQHLGAPGPQNLASPIKRDLQGLSVVLLDGTKAASAAPNRDRTFTPSPPTAPNGVLSIRRRVQNSTGTTVTRLRFRVVELTTFPSPGAGTADLRVITSSPVIISNINDPATCASTGTPTTVPCQVTAQATTLETPPAQPNGGGYNSTISVSLPGGGLVNGASIDVNFALGVVQGGTFRFFIIVEALP